MYNLWLFNFEIIKKQFAILSSFVACLWFSQLKNREKRFCFKGKKLCCCHKNKNEKKMEDISFLYKSRNIIFCNTHSFALIFLSFFFFVHFGVMTIVMSRNFSRHIEKFNENLNSKKNQLQWSWKKHNWSDRKAWK